MGQGEGFEPADGGLGEGTDTRELEVGEGFTHVSLGDTCEQNARVNIRHWGGRGKVTPWEQLGLPHWEYMMSHIIIIYQGETQQIFP